MRKTGTLMRDFPHCRNSRHGRLGSALAFAAAVALFFLVGFYVIGPWIQGAAKPTAGIQTRPAPTDREPSSPASEAKRIPAVSVEITERSKPAPAQSSPQRSVPPAPQTTPAKRQQPPQRPENLPVPQEQAQPAGETAASSSETAPQKLYRVKAGVFEDRANAEALVQKLAESGYSASVVKTTVGGAERSTVQVGAFSDRANAEKLATSLRNSGFDATVSTSE